MHVLGYHYVALPVTATRWADFFVWTFFRWGCSPSLRTLGEWNVKRELGGGRSFLSISCELLGKQEGFYLCKISFPKFFLLNTVTECFFKKCWIWFQCLSRYRSFTPGWWGPEVLGISGQQLGCSVGMVTQLDAKFLSYPSMECPSKVLISIAYLKVKYFGIFKTVQIISRECTCPPWDVICNCSFYLTEQLSFLWASFRGWLCQSAFSSWPRREQVSSSKGQG